MMRKGLIKISDSLYKNEWHKIFIFMQDFRPTHIEFRHWENDVWYFYGVSEKFDELIEGQSIPEYNVIFKEENGTLSYHFEKY